MVSDLLKLSDDLHKMSLEYAQVRNECYKNKLSLDLILASRLAQLQKEKRNAGIDVLRLMLIATDEKEVRDYYTNWQNLEAKYKGLEKIIDAIQEKINVRKLLVRSDSIGNVI